MENNIINPHNEIAMPAKRNLPRDVFLHLFAIVTLYWSCVAFITLCWQYINYFFPDNLYYYSSVDGYSSPMRFALASLLIVYPLFIFVSWILNKIYSKESHVRESKVRKWLIYLTLFITALVVIGDLVVVVNTFFGGEITARFILKAFSILVVAAVVFGYYLDDVRRDTPSPKAKMFAIGASVVVVVLFIGAFFIVGSPMKAREAQFDQRRIYDLQNIQSQVVYYWQQKGILPATLADLNNSISGYVAPVDPETGLPYEYTIKNAANLQFELCATFKLDGNANNAKSVPMPAYYGTDMLQNWNHTAGRACFERTIDPQLQAPFKG